MAGPGISQLRPVCSPTRLLSFKPCSFRAVAVFTAPHEDHGAAHLRRAHNNLQRFNRQLEQVENDAFPTALVTKIGV
jgi:hypothetical protein